jgi:hypothetical protein
MPPNAKITTARTKTAFIGLGGSPFSGGEVRTLRTSRQTSHTRTTARRLSKIDHFTLFISSIASVRKQARSRSGVPATFLRALSGEIGWQSFPDESSAKRTDG